MQKVHQPDYLLMLIFFALVVFGLIMVASASVVLGHETHGDRYYYFKHQLYYVFLLGLPVWIIFQRLYYQIWKKFGVVFLFICIILLILVFIPPFSFGYGGATRWLRIGPLFFQPTELTKLAFVLYLAAWLEKRGKQIKEVSSGLVPFIVITIVIALLIALQPDIGTLLIITLTAGVVYFSAGGSLKHLVFLAISGLIAFFLLVRAAPYRMARFIVFLHPEIDPKGIGYQVNQALMAIGSGGVLGLGLGHSRQKFNYLPEPAGDSIFAIIGEEMGLVGTVSLVFLFLLIAYKGYKIARDSPDNFAQLVACGITSWFVIQAFVNIGSIISIIPLTGVPLPFISYGGSSLVTSLAAAGILLNISRYTQK